MNFLNPRFKLVKESKDYTGIEIQSVHDIYKTLTIDGRVALTSKICYQFVGIKVQLVTGFQCILYVFEIISSFDNFDFMFSA